MWFGLCRDPILGWARPSVKGLLSLLNVELENLHALKPKAHSSAYFEKSTFQNFLKFFHSRHKQRHLNIFMWSFDFFLNSCS